MNDLRTAAQQALEALEGSAGILQHEHVWPGAEKKSRFVITALRAALAQQAEPVEPVAWTLTKTLTERKTTTNGFLWFSDPVNSSWTALYTAPPRREQVLLTDEEIDALPWNGSPRQFARAVEKAFLEKNK